MRYELVDGRIVIRAEDGTVRWQGRPEGYPVKALSPLPRDGAIVLLDYMAGPKNFANLLRVREDGTVAWRVDPPDASGNDAFVEFRWDLDELIANSWSGYLVRIDLETGSIKDRAFVK